MTPTQKVDLFWTKFWNRFSDNTATSSASERLFVDAELKKLATELERVREESAEKSDNYKQLNEWCERLVSERDQLKRQVEELKAEKIMLVAQNSSLDRALTRVDAQNVELKSLLIDASQRLRLHNLTSKRKDTDLIEAIRQAID